MSDGFASQTNEWAKGSFLAHGFDCRGGVDMEVKLSKTSLRLNI